MGAIPSASVLPDAAGMSPAAKSSQEVDSKYGETLAAKSVERDMTQHDTAMTSLENISKTDMMLKHLKSSDAITGLGSDVLKNAERVRVLFSQSEKAGKRVSDTELLDTFLGSDVFPMIKTLGIGARGMDTPAEREFLRSVMTGTTTMNRETLIRMTEIRRDIAKRAIERWNDRIESGELDRYFDSQRMPKKKMEIPVGDAPRRPETGGVEFNGYRFPDQKSLDAYKKASGTP